MEPIRRVRSLSVVVAALSLWLTLVGESSGQTLLWDRSSPPLGFLAATSGFGGTAWVLSDLNGDGVKDLLVGVPYQASYWGVISGATGATIAEHYGLPVEALRPVGVLGDVNGDGFADFLTIRSVAGLFLTEIVSGATLTPMGTIPQGSGSPFATALGDLNGDGLGDFAMRYQNGFGAGIWIAHGPAGQPAIPIAPLSSWVCYTTIASIAPCGDVNQDGVSDLVIGYPCQPPVQYPWGLGYAGVFSGANGASIWTSSGPSIGSRFGSAVAGPGDVNGDGVPDVVIGLTGGLNVFSGNNGSPIATLSGSYGTLEALGDVDGDAVGDYAAQGSQIDVISGATTTPLMHLVTNLASGYPGGYNIGGTILGLADFNGDDYPEVVVGCSSFSTQPGRIQCYTLRPAGIAITGSACPQSNGTIARISAAGSAHPGASFPVNLSRVPPGTAACLVVGLSNTQYGSISLPWQVDPMLAPGCLLRCSIDWNLPAVTASASPGVGSATIALPVPLGTAGLTFFAQWGVVNPPGSAAVASITRLLSVTIL